MVERIGYREQKDFAAGETTKNPELDEAMVEQRFSEIVEAEKLFALANPEEQQRRNATQGYKPNQGYDIKQQKHA